MISMEKRHYGWSVLVACCALVFGIGTTMNVVGQYFVPVTEDLGLGMGEFTFYYSIRGVALVLSTLLLGKWLDKVDARLLLSVCFAVQLICTALMSTFTQVWHWYIVGAVMGFFLPPVYFMIPPIILSNWFVKKRGFVIGIAMAFSGVGGAIMNPVIARIIEQFGWRFAYVANAVIAGVIVLPFLMFVIRLKPADKGLLPYGYEENSDPVSKADNKLNNELLVKGVSKARATRSLSFILLIILFAFCGFFAGYPQHLSAYGKTLGLTVTTASLLLSLSMIGNVLTKLVLGLVNDKFGGKIMMACSLSMIMVSLIMLLIGQRSMPALLIGALLSGSFLSVSSVVSPLLAQTVYGPKDFAKIFVLLSMSQNLLMSVGPTIVGFMFDFSGGYSVPLIVGIVAVICAVCLAALAIKSGRKLQWT